MYQLTSGYHAPRNELNYIIANCRVNEKRLNLQLGEQGGMKFPQRYHQTRTSITTPALKGFSTIQNGKENVLLASQFGCRGEKCLCCLVSVWNNMLTGSYFWSYTMVPNCKMLYIPICIIISMYPSMSEGTEMNCLALVPGQQSCTICRGFRSRES